MYTPGKLIYFDPFFFKDDNANKPKYFLVIKVIGEDAILTSLPSSQVHLPRNQAIEHGCLELPESGIGCYIFLADKPITKGGWSFPLNTFLYGLWLDDFAVSQLEARYIVKGVDYKIIGELTDTELKNVVDCFKNSGSVKRKYKRLLE